MNIIDHKILHVASKYKNLSLKAFLIKMENDINGRYSKVLKNSNTGLLNRINQLITNNSIVVRNNQVIAVQPVQDFDLLTKQTATSLNITITKLLISAQEKEDQLLFETNNILNSVISNTNVFGATIPHSSTKSLYDTVKETICPDHQQVNEFLSIVEGIL